MRQVSDLFVAKACNPYEIAHYEEIQGIEFQNINVLMIGQRKTLTV